MRFGFNIIRGDILNSATYGVWSYHHGDNTRFRGMPSAFWEIYSGDSITGVVLQQLTDVLDGGRILHRGFFPTIDYSYSKSRNLIHEASSVWISKLCREIIDGNHNNIAKVEEFGKIEVSEKIGPIYGLPSNFEMMRFLWIQISNFVKRRLANAFNRPSWKIKIVNGSNEQFLSQSCVEEVGQVVGEVGGPTHVVRPALGT